MRQNIHKTYWHCIKEVLMLVIQGPYCVDMGADDKLIADSLKYRHNPNSSTTLLKSWV